MLQESVDRLKRRARLLKRMNALLYEPDVDDADRRVLAYELYRTIGGPLTAAERAASYRARHAFVTESPPGKSNGHVTELRDAAVTPDNVVPPVVCSRNKNELLRKEATEVLAFLNQKVSRSYRFNDTNLKLIEGRLQSGSSIQDCKSIIAKKTREWISDPKMSMYLRPATLFNKTKFEQYLGELGGQNGVS